MINRRRPGLRRRRGQALIEFCFSVPILLLLFVGIFELTRVISTYTVMTDLASDTAGLWARPDNQALTQTDIEAIVVDSLQENNIDTSSVSVSVSTRQDPNDASLNQRIVAISYSIQPITPPRIMGRRTFDPTMVIRARAIYPEEQAFY